VAREKPFLYIAFLLGLEDGLGAKNLFRSDLNDVETLFCGLGPEEKHLLFHFERCFVIGGAFVTDT